ncbi:hypothetical protein THASP1DRAFT_29164 [Thamnocephalis sphaerospora]|uniref:Mediator of RNA polymerase II transcription subunit 12 n=1 Tax=Thamnocephalis sphaerospora TaxID=78915 RepID=A0A4P9XSD9_9FUNG|nr:hypothetical protein THASP1DRAFT_29164 [Thamnocephalis sphaerospora]|eukprot:RKP09035.1 hypothetical protein THASP1DRAFT_29164 [Thamnocephalis sphaerospora]
MSGRPPGSFGQGQPPGQPPTGPHRPVGAPSMTGAAGGLFSTSSAFASRVAMGHFTHTRPNVPIYGYAGAGASTASHLSAFAAQASSLGAHAHARHSAHAGRYPGAPSPSQISASVASPPAGGGGRMSRHDQPLSKYRLAPPPSLPSLHCDNPTVYPDYHAHQDGQLEDRLNQHVVQRGYKARAPIENECMSAHDLLHDQLRDAAALSTLDEFMTDVMRRQMRTLRVPRDSSWKPPVKCKTSDLKKEQWLQDLVNPTVPLHALAHSIPIGLRGEKLLDELATRQPPLARAVWSIKAIAMAEMESAAAPSSTLALELKNNMAQFLEMQLAELAGGPRASGTSGVGFMTNRIVGNAFRPWQNEESRTRWTGRWWYSTWLAEWLHSDGLMEQRHFLKWVLDRLATSGLEQTAVLLPLVAALQDDIARSRALTRLLIDALLDKLHAVFRSTTDETKSRRFSYVVTEIASVLQTVALRWPDAFVQPRSWHRHHETLKRIMAVSVASSAQRGVPARSGHDSKQLRAHMAAVQQRNVAFTVEIGCAPSEEDVELLNQLLRSHTNVNAYARWIDMCTVNKARDYVNTVVLLFDQLMRARVFSYTRYLRRLIARGALCDVAVAADASPAAQKQADILRALPVYDPHSVAARQRRIQLYGVNDMVDPDEETIRQLTTRLAARLPYLTSNSMAGGGASNLSQIGNSLPTPPAFVNVHARPNFRTTSMTDPLVDDPVADYELQLEMDEDTVRLLQASNRYCQIRVTANWLMGLVKQFVVKEVQIGMDNWRVITSPGSSLLNARQMATLIRVMELARDYNTLIELTMWVMDHTNDHAIAALCTDTLLRYERCWAALDMQQAVFGAFAYFASKGQLDFAIFECVKRLVLHGHGTMESVKSLLSDTAKSAQPLSSLGASQRQPTVIQLPDRLSDMRFQPLEMDAQHVAMLANSLREKYHTETGWFPRLLELLHMSLDKHIAAFGDAASARRKLVVFANLLENLIRTSFGMRSDVNQWLVARLCAAEMTQPECRHWRLALTIMLLARGCCDVLYVLEHICLPILAEGVERSMNDERIGCIVELLAAILLQQSIGATTLSTAESLALSARMTAVVSTMAQVKPILALLDLLVQLEATLPLSNALRHHCQWLRLHLLNAAWFRSLCLVDPMRFAEMLVATASNSQRTAAAVALLIQSGLLVLDTAFAAAMSNDVEIASEGLANRCLAAFSRALTGLSVWNVDNSRAIVHLALAGLAHHETSASSETDMLVDGVTGQADCAASDALQRMARTLFDSTVLTPAADIRLLASIIGDAPTALIAEFVSHGLRVMEGLVDPSFPGNVLLFPELATLDNDFSTALCRMHLVMTLLLTKSDAATEETACKQAAAAQALLSQTKRFEENRKVFATMAFHECTYGEAIRRLNASDDAQLPDLLAGQGTVPMIGDEHFASNVTLDQFRRCLELRLRLLVPLLKRLLDKPHACATGEWAITLLRLLTNPLVYGNATGSSLFTTAQQQNPGMEQTNCLFDFVLDILSFFLDELPKETRTSVLDAMRMMEAQLVLPAAYAERIRRVLPFKVRYRYQETTRQELRILLDPWRWLEDTPTTATKTVQSVSTPAPFTPNTSGAAVSGISGNGASSNTTSRGKPDTRNDTPLSLALFRARRLQTVDSPLIRAVRAGRVPRGWSYPSVKHSSTATSTFVNLAGRVSPEPGELSEMDVDQKHAAGTPSLFKSGHKRPAEDAEPRA